MIFEEAKLHVSFLPSRPAAVKVTGSGGSANQSTGQQLDVLRPRRLDGGLWDSNDINTRCSKASLASLSAWLVGTTSLVFVQSRRPPKAPFEYYAAPNQVPIPIGTEQEQGRSRRRRKPVLLNRWSCYTMTDKEDRELINRRYSC